jgi:transmembrane sensor
MFNRSLYISELILKQWQGQLTIEERGELDRWVRENPENKELLQQVMNEEWAAGELDKFTQYDIPKSRKRLELFLYGQTAASKPRGHRILFIKTTWLRYAAVILLIVGVCAYLYTTKQRTEQVQYNVNPILVQKDVLPGSDKAILTLANGQRIQLDSSSNSVLAKQGIFNDHAVISYSGAVENNAINTLTTPRGGQYQLRLNDGTMVWLNAASSITYPSSFTGNQREVVIVGEAYFEVAKDKNKPFRVNANGIQVEVLGTHFNINAYSDEQSVKTSLLEGSVRINNRVLKPGEAYYNGKVAKSDLNQDIAWKNGVFNFNNADLFAVMRQLVRWYNIDLKYEGKIKPRIFQGEMDKGLNLSQVIKILGEAGVKFRIDGNKLTVSE